MENKELVQKLREYLKDKESVDGNAAPALHLMRHALVALERPAITEVRQDVLVDDAVADQLAERESFIYGLLAELQLVPEVNGEPVDTLQEALAEDYEVLESLHDEIVQLFTRWNESPDSARDKDTFIGAVCNLLQIDRGTGLRDVWSALQAKAVHMASLEQGIAARDETIAALERGEPDYEFTASREPASDPAPDVRDDWVDDALDLAHAVRRDGSRENRVLAKAAWQLIQEAQGIPRHD